MRSIFYATVCVGLLGCGTMNYEETPTPQAATETDKRRLPPVGDAEPKKRRHTWESERQESLADSGREAFTSAEVQLMQLQYEDRLDRQKSVLNNRILMSGLLTGGLLGAAFYLFHYKRLLKQYKGRPTRGTLRSMAIGGACGFALAFLGVQGPRYISPPPDRPRVSQPDPSTKNEGLRLGGDDVRRETREIIFPSQ